MLSIRILLLIASAFWKVWKTMHFNFPSSIFGFFLTTSEMGVFNHQWNGIFNHQSSEFGGFNQWNGKYSRETLDFQICDAQALEYSTEPRVTVYLRRKEK